jgi:RNA methyltransferase, TrmH family
VISKTLIKHIISLQQAKFRDLHGEFIAEGVKVVGELILSDFNLKYICALTEWLEANSEVLKKSKAEIIEVKTAELERIRALSTPNKVLAVFEKSPQKEINKISQNDLVLALDDIRDPGNLGTIIRIADWFGIETVVCSSTTVDIYNPKTVQATMGSIARVNTVYLDLAEFLKRLPKDIIVFGTDLEGEDIYNADLPAGGIIIIGSESHGLSEALLPGVQRKLYIPSFNKKSGESAESLNASVAAAIVCSEFRRRLK